MVIIHMKETSHETEDATPQIPWKAIFETLKKAGINSVMIEGGATVISALLQRPDLVDAVIITIAPTWLGQGGVSVSPPTSAQRRTNAAWLQDTSWLQFGNDVVLCGKLRPRDFNQSGS